MSEFPTVSDEQVLHVLGISNAPHLFQIEVTDAMRNFATQIDRHVSTLNLDASVQAVDELITFVETMDIADHLSATRNMRDGIMINPLYADLSEAEFKRMQLINDLQQLKGTIASAIVHARSIMADALCAHWGYSAQNTNTDE